MHENVAFAISVLTDEELAAAIKEARASSDLMAPIYSIGSPGIWVGLVSLLVERELREPSPA